MIRVIAIIAALFVICDIGLAGALYIKHHPQAVSEKPVAMGTPEVRRTAQSGPSHASMIGDREHMTLAERVEFDQRQADAIRIIARSRDLFLTGDPDGIAEWFSANEEAVKCGVTPQGRYLLIKNELGNTRYDEHLGRPTARFEAAWNRADCQTTAPVNQAKLVANAAEERLYQATHPVDSDCLIRQLKEMGTGGTAAARRQLAHPHECNRTRAEWLDSIRAHSDQGQGTTLQNGGGP